MKSINRFLCENIDVVIKKAPDKTVKFTNMRYDAYHKGKNVGYILMVEAARNPEDNINLRAFYILKPYRGQGIARKLLEAVRKDYWDQDIILNVQPYGKGTERNKEETQSMYEHFGFKVYPHDKTKMYLPKRTPLKEKSKYNEEDLRDHYGIGAVIHKDDKILIFKHVKFGFWTFPVGKGDFDKPPVEAMKREVWEEVGIKVTKAKLVIREKRKYRRINKYITVDAHIYDVLAYTGKPRNMEPHKHSEMVWLSVQELRDMQKKGEYIGDMLNLWLKTQT